MVVRKITVSLEEGAYRAAVEAARAAGLSLSAWLSGYAEHRARVEAGLRAIEGYEAEYGPLSGAGTVTAADSDPGASVDLAARLLDELGVGQPIPDRVEQDYRQALATLRAGTGPGNRPDPRLGPGAGPGAGTDGQP